jgi:hypothetical protein
MKITKEQIENWVGGDNQHPNYYLELLEELLNGEYSISEMRNDVINYNDDDEIPPQWDKEPHINDY